MRSIASFRVHAPNKCIPLIIGARRTLRRGEVCQRAGVKPGPCSAPPGAPPRQRRYPFVTQLERAAGFVRADVPAAKLDKLEAMLATTSSAAEDLTLIAELLSIPTDDRYPSLNLLPQRKREKPLEALLTTAQARKDARSAARAARRAGAAAALLMVFEDVHWIDASSRDLLHLDRTNGH